MSMKTPVCDFVRDYGEKQTLRLHMPGHKGKSLLGMEDRDLTEIPGADDLYDPQGILAQSEKNASALFGCPTYYSTEGASQCVRGMLYLAMLDAKAKGLTPRIAAGRNAHKTFLTAAALLDVEVSWLYPPADSSYLSCVIKPAELEAALTAMDPKPTAVYVTSPDYLGHVTDIQGLAKVCHRHGLLLLVDNAHGAYLRFLPQSRFPMDLGADLCCSSAHKTLPVLTGGAYLHLSADFEKAYGHQVKSGMALFGSTSPSYLILQSLDAANAYLAALKETLAVFLPKVAALKSRLVSQGYVLLGDEPMKLCLSCKPYGYTGKDFADALAQLGIIAEFFDPDYVVLMPTPQLDDRDLDRLTSALLSIPQKTPIQEAPPRLQPGQQVCPLRQAALGLSKIVPVEESLGCILANTGIGCPPAVPILVCGERIDEHAIRCFRYYGIEKVSIIDEK